MKNIETSIFTEGSVAVIVWKNEEKWPIEFATESVEDILGYNKETLLNDNISFKDMIDKDDLLKVETEVEKFIALDVDSFNLTPYQIKNRDGSSVWLKCHIKTVKNENREITNFYSYIVDITSQIETKNELDIIFNGIADGAVIVDIISKKIVKVNGAFLKMVGFDSYELFEMNILDIISYKNRDDTLKLISSFIKGTTNYAKEVELKKKDGGTVYANITANQIYLNQHNSLIAIIKDITELKMMGEERKKHEKILFQQSRLAAMGEMISMIAHQWRQPLSTISTIAANLEIRLSLGTLDTKEFSDSLKNINDQTQHLSSTINDFREFFNPNKEEKSVLLTAVINKAVSIIDKTLYTNGIQIDVTSSFTNPIMTYPNEVVQVILNLIKNANDAHMKKGTENPLIKVMGYESENSHIIEISDNAGGIDKNIIEQIFDPYFTTKDEKNGTGLGLYISKIIIENHCKGKLEVKNIEDSDGMAVGAEFSISFLQ